MAQISIEGVSDKKGYKDKVSFTVISEADYDYTVELNGRSIETDVSVEVTEPEYYELYVYRRERASGIEQSELMRFIVRASERGNSEFGLPRWSPYLPINSAEAEFAGAELKIIAPAEYPMGLEIPVVARVEDDLGNRLGINSVISTEGFQDHPLQLLRGVGSIFLPAATEPNIISYTAETHSLHITKRITIEADTTWQTISGDIATTTDWGENSRIHISNVAGNLLTIEPGAILTIGAGSVIIIDPDIEIGVQGNVVVNGTMERPVVFTAPERAIPWGGFLFESNESCGQFSAAIFTASGADSNWFNNNPGHGGSHRKDQCLFYLADGANVTLTDCYMVENHGQIGHGENSYLTMTGCLVQKCTTVGQFNGGAVIFEDCALIEFPSADASYVDGDNDTMYLTKGTHSLTDCLIGWALDDGIDAGASSGGSLTVNRCWFESCCHEGMALSGPKDIFINDSVFLNCGQGIECGYDAPDVNAVNCLCTTNLVGARFGDNYDWNYDNGFLTVTDSLLLFNNRDVWGRAWDNWQVHLDQMDIRHNYLSAVNTNHPNNLIWDPMSDPNQAELLRPFLSTPADAVGIGFATSGDVFDLSDIPDKIHVRLSTFTTVTVYVDYTIETEDGLYASGSLQFIPSQTVKYIQFEIPPINDINELHIILSNPVNAELTGYRRITYSVQ
ncbi:MAG: hypothetical protein JXA81_13410 [Sedimentisphaerales bacterium]|nr:hypothetical protein [Sedimentisphaerales bacterium]